MNPISCGEFYLSYQALFSQVCKFSDKCILDYNRFRQLKEQEKRSKKNKAVAKDTVELVESQSESEEGSDDEEEEAREEALASSTTSKPLPDVGQRRSKRSKRKRTV